MPKLSELAGIGLLVGSAALSDGCVAKPQDVKVAFEQVNAGTPEGNTAQVPNEMRRLLNTPGYITDSVRPQLAYQARVMVAEALDQQQHAAHCLTIAHVDVAHLDPRSPDGAIYARLQTGPFPNHVKATVANTLQRQANPYRINLDSRLSAVSGGSNFNVARDALAQARSDADNCETEHPASHAEIKN